MINVNQIADKAQMIVNGYAFTKIPMGIQVVNLARMTACVINSQDDVIEAIMDDIELDIVMNYYARNKQFMEDNDA